MKVSLSLIISITLGVHAAVSPNARCSSNSCLAKVNKNLDGPAHACGEYKPVTRTPKAKTTTIHTRMPSATVTKKKTVTVSKSATVTKTKTTFATTVTVTRASRAAAEKRTFEERAVAAATLKPLPVPNFATNVCSGYSQYSSACSCLGHTRTLVEAAKPTVTRTVTNAAATTTFSTTTHTKTSKTTTTATVNGGTKTVTVRGSPTPDCGNDGLQFANYANNQGVNDDGDYTQFDPAAFKAQTPRDSGYTTSVQAYYAGPSGTISFYDGYEMDVTYFVLDHRGYVHAPATGSYTVYLQADDIALAWIGPNAYSGFTRANADVLATSATSPDPYTVDLVQGAFYPIRVMYANAASYGGLNFTMTKPDGGVLLDTNTLSSVSIQYAGCEEADDAPAYPDWGSET